MDSDDESDRNEQLDRGSSPASRGGAGVYIEGELGAIYLLAMLTGSEPRGLPGARLERVQFQGVDEGFTLDDLILHGRGASGACILEIQSKRDATFAKSDPVFRDVCRQIAKSGNGDVPEERHYLGVATQRTSRAISGPYQDVLQWAHAAKKSEAFFQRLNASGVANKSMRGFVETFRANVTAAGVADKDDVIWRFLRRMLILEFDFEANASLARTYALSLARAALSEEVLDQAEALLSNLIEISIATGKVGGELDRKELSSELAKRGFRLAGDRRLGPSRNKLAEKSSHSLSEIGDSLAGVRLPRIDAIAKANAALDENRYVELRGDPGVGKSWVLRHLAERTSQISNIVVLDPIATPKGGWSALARELGVEITANAFLNDLAASGGGTLFIDSLEMFTEAERQRTVNDLLREVSAIRGFSVVATARTDFGIDGGSWLAEDAMLALGPAATITIGELQDNEVELLCEQAPELRTILASDHPAAPIARNLYRLSRLLKVPDAAVIRTEAALVEHWWETADGAQKADVREAQRILSNLTKQTLAGADSLHIQSDSSARAHLLDSLALREIRRDHLTFYHDVLRDWSVASLLYEDPKHLSALDLSAPVSPRIARGVELAARQALEREADPATWLSLLESLSPPGSHGSWRRQALIAIVRSEIGPELLERCNCALLAKGGILFRDLCAAINSLETIPAADLLKGRTDEIGLLPVPRSMRANTTGSAVWLLRWCLRHASDIPITAIRSVLDLIQIQSLVIMQISKLAEPTARMLYGWLMQLDFRDAERTIPTHEEADRLDHQGFLRLVDELRQWSGILAGHAPTEAQSYLRAVTKEGDHRKVNVVRALGQTLAKVAPQELSDLVGSSLILTPDQRAQYSGSISRAFSFAENDYLPPSPAQPPFLDLLEADPEIGLELVRKLTKEAVAFHSGGSEPGENGYTLIFEDGPRFFPWQQTYFWSRDQATEYSVASALKALEAWGHLQLDTGASLDRVLKDVLGPKGSCAAYLLVAVDLLISHWPKSREALVPFLSCPQLIATERGRQTHDQMSSAFSGIGEEPPGKVQLADLAKRPSRGRALEYMLPLYLPDESNSQQIRERLGNAVEALGEYEEDADFGDPAFMGAYALNLLERKNWVEVEKGRSYQSPPREKEHLERIDERSKELLRSSDIEAKIQLAIDDRARSTPDLAREAYEHANGELPDESDADVLSMRSTRLVTTAMLIARDGSDELLAEAEDWVRKTIDNALAEDIDLISGSNESIRFNRPALAICAFIHLWHRNKDAADRDEIISLSARKDRAVPLALAASMDTVLESDARVLKAATRVGFGSSHWRWHPYDEEPEKQEQYEREKKAADLAAAQNEVAWLNGGAEPKWPDFPSDRPLPSRRVRLRVPKKQNALEADTEKTWIPPSKRDAEIRVDSQAAAAWLRILSNEQPHFDWCDELLDAYAEWSANLNGHGLPRDNERNGRDSDWNSQFYRLIGSSLLTFPQAQFESQMALITALPDRSFGDVVETLILAADIAYFNDPSQASTRAVELREILVERAMTLRGWNWARKTNELSIDHDTGSIVGRLFMNSYGIVGPTKTYLVPAVFDRVDPLLDALRPMLAGGPTAFIALSTMNTLLVAPRAGHLDFLLTAAEAWLQRSGKDPTMWLQLRIGRQVIEWFNRTSDQDATLLAPDSPYRGRIDSVVGRLVDFGVPEAHEFDLRVMRA